MADKPVYRGRFAPSPTGPLHLGSLLAAVASYLDAKAADGQWLVRIEDIDPPREAPGAADSILRSLEAHGLTWDESVFYQSTRKDAYTAALSTLHASGDLFFCSCTRATLGPGGSCLERCRPDKNSLCTQRFRLRGGACFDDLILGAQASSDGPGDLVLRRKDGLFAYALAVVVDDAQQRITHVVRGRDLLPLSFGQIELFHRLGLPAPAYAHVPLIRDPSGIKLSKQTGAPAIEDSAAVDNLRSVLRYLKQDSADQTAGSACELLDIAARLWRPQTLTDDPQRTLVYRRPTTP